MFLTPQGRKPEISPVMDMADKELLEKSVIPLSWKQMAFHLEKAGKSFEPSFIGMLARAFCRHVCKF
jgi:hypothetical protein